MARTTPTNLVTKTEQTGNTLVALADRIGLGFGEVVGHDPATVLSQGLLPMPQLPMAMPPSTHGSSSGDKACRRSHPRANPRYRGALSASRKPVGASRVRDLGLSPRSFRLASDCQSPDRFERQTSRNANSISNWRQIAGSTPAAAN